MFHFSWTTYSIIFYPVYVSPTFPFPFFQNYHPLTFLYLNYTMKIWWKQYFFSIGIQIYIKYLQSAFDENKSRVTIDEKNLFFITLARGDPAAQAQTTNANGRGCLRTRVPHCWWSLPAYNNRNYHTYTHTPAYTAQHTYMYLRITPQHSPPWDRPQIYTVRPNLRCTVKNSVYREKFTRKQKNTCNRPHKSVHRQPPQLNV